MAKDFLARKDGTWMIISTAPDVCKTPIGSSIVPIPYPVVAYLSDSKNTSPNVRANNDYVVILAESFVSQTIGDAAGSATGIKSGTVGGKCYFDEHSKSVRVNKRQIIRHGDKAWMNGA